MFGLPDKRSPESSLPLLSIAGKTVPENLYKLNAVALRGISRLGPQFCNFLVRFQDSKELETLCGSSSSNYYNIERTDGGTDTEIPLEMSL